MMLVDADEFIFPQNGCSLAAYLDSGICSPFRSHISVPWNLFGTSGHTHQPEGLVLENYLMHGGDRGCRGHGCEGNHEKVIVNTLCVRQAIHASNHEVENLELIPNYCHNGHNAAHLGDKCESGITFNHYSTKSKDEYFNVKAKRGSRGSNILSDSKRRQKYFDLRNLNDIGGFQALKYLRAIRDSVGKRQSAEGVEMIISARASPKDKDGPDGMATEIIEWWADLVSPTSQLVCFSERDYVYTPKVSLFASENYERDYSNTQTALDCCLYCHVVQESPSCNAWTFHLSTKTCTLMHGITERHRTAVEEGFTSGSPLQEECDVNSPP
jgi:hypothetical protein